jgi:acetyl esterase/lipase
MRYFPPNNLCSSASWTCAFRCIALATSLIWISSLSVFAQAGSGSKKATTAKRPQEPELPKATIANVAYGEHERQVLDFWKAESETPTPCVFVIHGGGWRGGSKERTGRIVKVDRLLSAGISVVSINYRFVTQAEDVMPPVKVPLYDAARALQFVRSKAKEWNIDPDRIGATGSSAGACSSLWLAFHADLADPKSDDPIARQSTRPQYAAVNGAQTTLDPQQMKEWIPNSKYGAHAFGITSDGKPGDFEAFLKDREKILPWIAEYSPYELVSADDPPIYLIYGTAPAMGKEQKDPTHSSNFGVKLQEKCLAAGVKCELVYPGAANTTHKTITDYFLTVLAK